MMRPRSMRALFAPEAHQLLLMQIEAALAKVQARAGIIPADAAERIARSANLETVTMAAAAHARERVGHPMVALLEAWDAALSDGSGEWLHFGATTQDIEDSAAMLEARMGAALLLDRLKKIEHLLLDMAESHAATPMVGRTVGRHALPMTFGLKVSRWAAENRRGIERIELWLTRHSVGMLSGAVGSYASMGPKALELEKAFVVELGLDGPWLADWKGSRDMFAELGTALSILAMTWRKIAQEIFLLQGDDIGEVVERNDMVGSSTMPHKQNPRHCRKVMAQSRLVPGLSNVLLDWMVSIYERDQVSSVSALADICVVFDDMLEAVERMVESLEAQPEAMRRNLLKSGDIIMAEHAMFLLSGRIGKQTAHKLVRQAVRTAIEQATSLASVLGRLPELEQLGADIDWPRALDPNGYLGLSVVVTGRTIESLRAAAMG